MRGTPSDDGNCVSPHLIPVLVTGIQRRRVGGAGESLHALLLIHGADAPWLDPCDEHRDEGVMMSVSTKQR
ncbi:hypothetical protein CO661_27995 [Sinorhizobium fredii]|uniref:Uncharacterized protein n=1 Tax=Rhizobium fredii TaxID=380 RepID=A0A2A6LQU7_RHIFR|nr:hypothetical protein CO661_27995 [Sinorhizobium fredii]